MQTLKPSTRQLIESFRYRRLAYLPKTPGNRIERHTIAWNLMFSGFSDMRTLGHTYCRQREIKELDYRKHLMSYLQPTLHSTNEG